MKAAASPGPWTVRSGVAIDDARGRWIGSAAKSGRGWISTAEVQANAILMASAAELASVLERLDLTCHNDPLNPCSLSGVIGQHWGVGASCPACDARLLLKRVRP